MIDCLQVLCHIFANITITPCGTQRENTVQVNEFNSETVNLYLNDVLHDISLEQFFYPFIKIPYLIDGHGVLEAQHGYCVGNR